jgi:hypothetical protein
MCDNVATYHFIRVDERRPVEERHRCSEHASEVTKQYLLPRMMMAGIGPSDLPNAKVFDIDFTVYDERGVLTIRLQEIGGNKCLSLMTGYWEAYSLDIAMRRVTQSRPSTFPLMAQVITGLGGQLKSVLIDCLSVVGNEHVYHAKLRILRDDNILILDARPSDAIVLAVTCGAPILVADEVLDRVDRYVEMKKR